MGTIGADAGEWPLSPARLFSALVAGGGTGAHRRVPGNDDELRALEQAPPPLIFADPPAKVIKNPLRERFVVVDKNQKGTVQDYPGRVATLSRPGVRLCPKNPELLYCWPDLELSDAQRQALERRAARIGYVGASDAPAEVRLVEGPEDLRGAWEPHPYGSTTLNIAREGFLDVLDATYSDFLAGRYPTGSSIAREAVRYRSPAEPADPGIDPTPTPIRVWTRLDRPIHGGLTVPLAEAVKGLVLSSFGDIGSSDEAPGILTGHGLEPGTERARFWPLPNVSDHGDGRLFGVCINLPSGTAPSVVQRVEAAVAGAQIRLRGGRTVRTITGFAGERRPFASNPARWMAESAVWVSATPVVFERFRKGGPSAADVAEWCRNAALPEPLAFEISRVPLVKGAVDLQPHQTTHGNERPHPYGHVRLWFASTVLGPFAVGRMRSFGLGLMMADSNARPCLTKDNR